MAELKEARVPDIGGHNDVPVIELLVKPGDTVTKDQGLVTLESDKATMEVPSPFAGVIKEVKVKLGDTVSEGGLVAIIESAEAARAEPVAAPEVASAETGAKVEPVAVSVTPDRLTQQSITTAAAPVESGAPVPALAPVAEPGQLGIPPMRFEADAVLPAKVPYASPAVRLFARELGVDLMQVAGSGRGGRIAREDVQKFVKAALAGGIAAPVAASGGGGGGLNLLPWPKVDFAKFGEIETKPLSRIQKISGANLSRNWAMIPHVTQHDEADITELEALRVALNNENAKAIAAGKSGKVTMLAFLIKACVAALQKFPTFNASLEGDNLVLKKYFHIGFAADTPNGLVVPVLRDADRKGVVEIAKEMGELAALARDGKLKPEQMQGGCFTISSLGGIGGTAFTPIINAPEVAILGVSKSDTKPVWDGKQFQPRLMLPLSLSYDHRVIDGAAAARFTSYLGQLLADLRRAML
ncbi:dihydrolipoyllysine-residue acetyltransferase [Thermomonas brevis]|uniref:Dihydrolipoamide acetyltransferase component of pyruvate dehydrogenase complex n=1 Tax=Thermomonas brevis TaxID=215691 RepID=A0A7G9QWD2_9GAMM|nr:dihydrolipoyllysine-residue acetyltransferase [Thermomonas brevis]QNN47657.1 dihydrolipoyllysine-residue acetyltransferase [Thermomonas brevis]